MAIINGTNLLQKLCKEWNLDGAIRKLTIEIEYDDIVKITVLHYMKDKQADALIKTLKEYRLLERPTFPPDRQK